MKRSRIVNLMEWHPAMVESGSDGIVARIERVIKVAVEEERAACIKACNTVDLKGADECIAAIQARGQA